MERNSKSKRNNFVDRFFILKGLWMGDMLYSSLLKYLQFYLHPRANTLVIFLWKLLKLISLWEHKIDTIIMDNFKTLLPIYALMKSHTFLVKFQEGYKSLYISKQYSKIFFVKVEGWERHFCAMKESAIVLCWSGEKLNIMYFIMFFN